MTSKFAKTLLACLTVSAIGAASPALANNSFNKFPTQAQKTSQKTVKVSTYSAGRSTMPRTSTQVRTVTRVLNPTPGAASSTHRNMATRTLAAPVQTLQAPTRFNRMTTQTIGAAEPMPVIYNYSASRVR